MRTRTQTSSLGLMQAVEQRLTEGVAECLDHALAESVARQGQRGVVGGGVGWKRSITQRGHLRPRWARGTRGTVPSPRQRAPMSSFLMRCCSSTMPSSSASGRGGQPGT